MTIIVISIAFGIIIISLVILNLVTKLELRTEVIFDASKEKVWKVLTNHEAYREWNPFIISMSGEMIKDGQLTTVMVLNEKENTFTPIITVFDKNKTFEWLGTGLGGLFKGRHYFKLEEMIDGKTKMIHGEYFSGLLSGLVMQMIGKETQKCFVSMNGAMKIRIEGN